MNIDVAKTTARGVGRAGRRRLMRPFSLRHALHLPLRALNCTQTMAHPGRYTVTHPESSGQKGEERLGEARERL